MFDSIVNPIFAPLLKLPILWALIIVSFMVSLLLTWIYKLMTDQELMKTLKADMKNSQKEMKALKHDPKKMMAVQKKAMDNNMKYMMHSMKPTLVTFIPIIIIFGWLNAHIAYEPISPYNDFTTSISFKPGATGYAVLDAGEGLELLSEAKQKIKDNNVKWTLKGPEGLYLLQYEYDGTTYNKEVLITENREYLPPVKSIKDDKVISVSIDQAKVKVLNIGKWKIGWLGTYIIFSLIFSMGLRKIMKLH